MCELPPPNRLSLATQPTCICTPPARTRQRFIATPLLETGKHGRWGSLLAELVCNIWARGEEYACIYERLRVIVTGRRTSIFYLASCERGQGITSHSGGSLARKYFMEL